MAFRYDLHENPNTRGTNKTRYHARPANNNTISGEKLIEHMAVHCGISSAIISSVLQTMSSVLVEYLSEGDSIHIPGLGTVQASLSCPETRTMSATRAGSIRIKTINMRAEKALVEKVAENTKFVRTRFKTHSVEYDDITFLTLIYKFFDTHDFITRKNLELEFGLQSRTANNRLNKLVKDGVLKNASHDPHHPIYVLTEKATISHNSETDDAFMDD